MRLIIINRRRYSWARIPKNGAYSRGAFAHDKGCRTGSHLPIPPTANNPTSSSQRSYTSQSTIAINCLSILCFGITKASALLFYRRLFCVDGKHPTLRKVILVALPVVAVWTLVFELMTIFQCGTHFSAPWEGTKLKYCTWSYPSIEGVAVSNVLLDLFVVALPIYPVRVVPVRLRKLDSNNSSVSVQITKLATSQKSKIAIAGIFLIALV